MSKTALSEQILKLRSEGYSYNFISSTLGCSKGTVAYHCGTGQKVKHQSRALRRTDKQKLHKTTLRTKLQELSWRYKRLCGCKVCGIKDPIVLEFDHRDPTTKLTTVAQLISDRTSMTRLKDEIRKCDVLCANCHRRKTAIDRGYKQF